MTDDPEIGTVSRQSILNILVVAGFALLFVRLYQLQLLYHEQLGKKSEENSVRTIMKEPVRGYMFDRNGKLVVDVGPSYFIIVTPSEFDTTNIVRLSALLQMDPQLIRDRLARTRLASRFSPVRIKRDVEFRTLSNLEEHLYVFPGVSYEAASKRSYPNHARAAHLLGYCKEISDAQLARYGTIYQPGDIIGSTGLEASYETFLRGEKGFEYISVNSRGQFIGGLEDGKRDLLPKEGFDLLLSLDFDVQAYAESLMTNNIGAVVAVDPDNGGVIAMVSKPDFDPALFSGVTSADVWSKLNSDTSKPMFNRATMTRYPPGSTFKMMLAAAALQEGILDPGYRLTCRGAFRLGRRVFKDEHVHGSVNVVEAIQQSCNVFFYQLILKTGLDVWTAYGKKFGFGRPTGFDTGEETTGLLPSTEYYDRVYGKGRWTQGYLVSLGIGQGELGVSPLQMACFTAALANGGTLLQPHAVNSIRNKRTNRFDLIDHRATSLGIKPGYLDLIREGMRRCVEEKGGTGSLARVPGVQVAGKTGTAENPHGPSHAWFVGFAPFDHPKIAVAVLVENAGYGGTKAAPIAGGIMDRYLRNLARRQPAEKLESKEQKLNVSGMFDR